MAISPAEQRERLFNLYNQQVAQYWPEHKDLFVCPLCLDGYSRLALEGPNPSVSLAHIVPERLGGTICTLTCTNCNNGTGAGIEASLMERFQQEDRMVGVGRTNARLIWQSGDLGVDWAVSPDSKLTSLYVIQKQSNPQSITAFHDYLHSRTVNNEEIEFSLRFHVRNNRKKSLVALYHSAYLLMFSYFGYEFVVHPHFAPLREQILKPTEDIWKCPISILSKETADANLRDREHGVIFLRDPYEVIVAVMRLCPKSGRERAFGVVLPGLRSPEIPMTELKTFHGYALTYSKDPLLHTTDYLAKMWHWTRKPRG